MKCTGCSGLGVRAWGTPCSICGGSGVVLSDRTDAGSPPVSDARGPVTGIRSGDAVPTQIARQGGTSDGVSDVGTSSPAGEPSAWTDDPWGPVPVAPTLFDPIDGATFPTSAAVPVDLSPVVVERAHARRTDPDTSHDAARSVKPLTITDSRRMVLAYLAHVGPHTQQELEDRLGHDFTPSRIRTAVSELRKAGLVFATDARGLTRTGRSAIVWAITSRGRDTAAAWDPSGADRRAVTART